MRDGRCRYNPESSETVEPGTYVEGLEICRRSAPATPHAVELKSRFKSYKYVVALHPPPTAQFEDRPATSMPQPAERIQDAPFLVTSGDVILISRPSSAGKSAYAPLLAPAPTDPGPWSPAQWHQHSAGEAMRSRMSIDEPPGKYPGTKLVFFYESCIACCASHRIPWYTYSRIFGQTLVRYGPWCTKTQFSEF